MPPAAPAPEWAAGAAGPPRSGLDADVCVTLPVRSETETWFGGNIYKRLGPEPGSV